jgi:hypothetical protein
MAGIVWLPQPNSCLIIISTSTPLWVSTKTKLNKRSRARYAHSLIQMDIIVHSADRTADSRNPVIRSRVICAMLLLNPKAEEKRLLEPRKAEPSISICRYKRMCSVEIRPCTARSAGYCPWSMEWNGADGKRRGACACRSMQPLLVYKSDALQLQRLAIHAK